jgi:hypothetical protein
MNQGKIGCDFNAGFCHKNKLRKKYMYLIEIARVFENGMV